MECPDKEKNLSSYLDQEIAKDVPIPQDFNKKFHDRLLAVQKENPSFTQPGQKKSGTGKKITAWFALAAAALSIIIGAHNIAGNINGVPQTAPLMADQEMQKVLPGPEKTELSLIAVGDVMLARKLDVLIKKNGMAYPFQKIGALTAQADLSFANLESPLSDRGKKIAGKGIWFRGDPENVQALTMAGFDVLSLANNHAVDYDAQALLDTIDILRGAGIAPVGAGKDIAQAQNPAVLEINGIRMAFLAYSEMADIIWSTEHPRMLQADQDTPGIAPLVLEDIEKNLADARKLADWVVVSLHWGREYEFQPQQYQREIARSLIDAGADLIIGHHPHVFQGMELYQGHLIAYSLGNFVFDQNWSEMTKEGLLLKFKLSQDRMLETDIYPIYIDDGQPVLADAQRGWEMLRKTQIISQKLGTEIEIAEGCGKIRLTDQAGEKMLNTQ